MELSEFTELTVTLFPNCVELVPGGELVNQSSVISCADYLFMNGLLRLTSFSESV